MKKTRITFLISLIGFTLLFLYFNSGKSSSDLFKSGKDIFLEEYFPIEIRREKYLGKLEDRSNHMNSYMSFGKICLPELDQWRNKIIIGDYVTKKKGQLNLLIERNGKSHQIYFEQKLFDGAPPPCECEKLTK